MQKRYLPPFFMVTLLLLVAALSGCTVVIPETPAIEAPAPAVRAPAGYAYPEILVGTAWVADHLADPTVHLLDVSDKREAFEAGHLPRAQFVNWEADLTDHDDPVRFQILTRESLSELLSRLGVEKYDTIVLL